MRQAIHIFKKDARALWLEVLLLLALAALLGWTETHFAGAAGVAELLVILAVNYVIARVVHAEVIPGHNQFWLTRPYRWKSLLGAKLLFVLVFVNIPIFAAQCYMIVAEGFSFTQSLPGLIWSQVLMVVCVSLPATCLASLTAGLMPFLLSEFIMVGAAFISDAMLVRASRSSFLGALQAGPGAIEWVRDSLGLVVVTCFALFVLRLQYKTRQTEIGTRWAIGGAVVAAIVFLCTPWTLAMGVQSALSKQAFDGSSLNVGLESVSKSVFPPNPVGAVSLPIAVKGTPASQELEVDALSITLVAADGQTWNSGYVAPIELEGGAKSDPAETLADGILHVDPAFLNSEGARPVTVHAKLYLTSFGDPHSVTVPIQPQPVNALDGLRCAVGFFHQFSCQSIFRWPRRRVYAKTGEDGVESYIRTISYSPFPATLGFNPIEGHSFPTRPDATQATVTTKAPLSYFQIEREIPGVSLADFTIDAKRRALRPPPLPTSSPSEPARRDR